MLVQSTSACLHVMVTEFHSFITIVYISRLEKKNQHTILPCSVAQIISPCIPYHLARSNGMQYVVGASPVAWP